MHKVTYVNALPRYVLHYERMFRLIKIFQWEWVPGMQMDEKFII